MQAEPGYKGDTARADNKKVKLETGLVMNVPLFVEAGDMVRVDTRTGRVSRRGCSGFARIAESE